MMATPTQPAKVPEWATDGAAVIVEPSQGKKEQGWIFEKPPYEWFNWLLNTIYSWVIYFKTISEYITWGDDVDKDLSFLGEVTFDDFVNFDGQSLFNEIVTFNQGVDFNNDVVIDNLGYLEVQSIADFSGDVTMEITSTFLAYGSFTLDTDLLMDTARKIIFDTDTNLYRNAADTLKTDDSLIVGTTLYAEDITERTSTAGVRITSKFLPQKGTGVVLNFFNGGTVSQGDLYSTVAGWGLQSGVTYKVIGAMNVFAGTVPKQVLTLTWTTGVDVTLGVYDHNSGVYSSLPAAIGTATAFAAGIYLYL